MLFFVSFITVFSNLKRLMPSKEQKQTINKVLCLNYPITTLTLLGKESERKNQNRMASRRETNHNDVQAHGADTTEKLCRHGRRQR